MDGRHASQLKGLLWIVTACMLAGSLALGLPWFAQHIPWSWESKMSSALGKFQTNEICIGTPQANMAFQKLLARIYPISPEDHNLPIHIHFIEGDEVNAFATLGGNIFVYSALLEDARSAEELAGVLAHEIEHVHHRHIIQGVLMRLVILQSLSAVFTGGPASMSPQIAQIFLNLKFSKQQEIQADEEGFKRLHNGQVNVQGLKEFFQRMDGEAGAPSALLSDHPAGRDRAQMAERYAQGPSVPILNATEWQALKTMCK